MNAVRRRQLKVTALRKGASASAGKRLALLVRLAGIVLLAGLAAACVSRPVGDFGRARPSVLHDHMLPAVGTFAARQRRDPVSDFNQTDQEREMHDRTWRFLIAAHSRDWTFDTSVEMQRTRIGRPSDHKFMTDRYYKWLRETHYQSSRTRYSTVGRHIAADLDTLPTTFQSICAVIEVDRQRRVALNELGGFDDKVKADVSARRIENQWHIDWFVRALNYRYESYYFALDHLLVETPHEQSMAVDESLRRLKPWVDRANRGDFCATASGTSHGSVTIPSRFQTMVPDLEVIPQK